MKRPVSSPRGWKDLPDDREATIWKRHQHSPRRSSWLPGPPVTFFQPQATFAHCFSEVLCRQSEGCKSIPDKKHGQNLASGRRPDTQNKNAKCAGFGWREEFTLSWPSMSSASEPVTAAVLQQCSVGPSCRCGGPSEL